MRAVRTRVLSHAGTEVGLYESHCIAARLAMLITLSVLSSILWTLTSLVRLFLSVAYITPHKSGNFTNTGHYLCAGWASYSLQPEHTSYTHQGQPKSGRVSRALVASFDFSPPCRSSLKADFISEGFDSTRISYIQDMHRVIRTACAIVRGSIRARQQARPSSDPGLAISHPFSFCICNRVAVRSLRRQ